MKLNRKGMTLVELIAVITILGILSTISIVSISAILKESKVNECESIKDNLIVATKEYLADARLDLSGASGGVIVNTLMEKHYFSNSVTNPFTGEISNTLKNRSISYTLSADKTVKSVTIASSVIDCAKRVFPD